MRQSDRFRAHSWIGKCCLAAILSISAFGASFNRTDYATGPLPNGIAIGDFNNDGHQDFVVVSNGNNGFSFFGGLGDGTFAAPVFFSSGDRPGPIAAADFNLDGYLDVAVGLGGNAVTVHLGNGDGTFASPGTVSFTVPFTALEAGDLTRDGNVDLVVGSCEAGAVRVIRGAGDGTFAGQYNMAIPRCFGGASTHLQIVDLNNDSILDIAIASSANPNILVYRFNGSGLNNFRKSFLNIIGSFPTDIAKGDINGDGNMDLAVTNFNSQTVSVLLGDGFGNLAATASPMVGTAPLSLAVADWSGDGNLDIAVTNRDSDSVSLLIGDGLGQFPTREDLAVGGSPLAIGPADFSENGLLDMVVSNVSSANVSVLINTPAPVCTDNDGDGFGSPGDASCPNGAAEDCNDSADTIFPGASEICDAVDNDCSGVVDDNIAPVATTCGVGVCTGNAGLLSCVAGSLVDSCDPFQGAAAEVCDGLDNDCNDVVDNGIADILTGSDVGECRSEIQSCSGGAFAIVQTAIGPAAEVCDGLDNDCNDVVDNGIADILTGSDVGECRSEIQSCSGGAFAIVQTAIFPATEVCDGSDNDCDGVIDDNIADIFAESDVGECRSEIQSCINGTFTTVQTAILPATEVCDGLDNDCNAVVDDTEVLEIFANRHTVGFGSHPGSTKEPFESIEVCAYDKSDGSCSRVTCGGISHQNYQCIVDSCGTDDDELIFCCTTDDFGECVINAPPGDYIVISAEATTTKTVLPDPLGVSASDLVCGELKQKHLQQIVKADGKKVPGKTSRRKGSELLVIEPEFIEWSGQQELYPFVFEAVGDWEVSTAVAPPEGFVSDYDALAEQVVNEVEAVQFTITDIGSDWVPTEAKHTVSHGGRRQVILSRVGVRLTSDLAQQKGLDRSGHVLGQNGKPVSQAGFDPQAPPEGEIVGWIEPSPTDANWTVMLQVNVSTDLTLQITRGQGLVVETLANETLDAGEYEFTFDGGSLGRGRYFVTLVCGETVQSVFLVEK